jgi:hypothetical protein
MASNGGNPVNYDCAHIGPHLLLQANPVAAWNAMSPFLKSLAAV